MGYTEKNKSRCSAAFFILLFYNFGYVPNGVGHAKHKGPGPDRV
jgi:hypothetical protein